MTVSKSANASYGDHKDPARDRFPRIVIIIMTAEFCERFSYSGMKAFLTLYLRSKLGYSDESATEIYHAFSTFAYFFPILGGIIADNYLGKFRTILYLMFVYAAGNIFVAITAIPQLDLPKRLCTIIGLLMITIGTGGIKPCVTAFGGDQFNLPQQEKQLAVYFSILYFNMCMGNLIAKTVSPILRSEVHCLGDKDCYSLAFGAPGIVVLMSIVVFVSAKNRYVMKNPTGNMVFDFVKCVFLGIKNTIRGRNGNHTHWLDSTQHQYNKKFIRDVKKTLSILMLFTVLPIFWALLDQLGSRWTLQATKMDGRLGLLTIKSDQLQVIGPICILILIPLFYKYLYPFLERRNCLRNPLDKLTLGGVLAGVALIASALVEIYIKNTYPDLPQLGYSQLRVYNGNPCSINIRDNMVPYTVPSLSLYTNKHISMTKTEDVSMRLSGTCIHSRDKLFELENNKAISFFVNGNDTLRFTDNVDKSKSGLPVVRFLVTNRVNSATVILFNERRKEIESYIYPGVSLQMEVFTSMYTIRVGDEVIMEDVQLDQGGVYTIMIDKVAGVYQTRIIVITEPNSITMALMLPQFLIMSIAEVLFVVTGNEFAFKEAPESMKAVMTAVWLLTEAAGNALIIIITRVFVNYQQETQSFIYSGLMFTSIAFFHYLSRGYKFGVEDECIVKKEVKSKTEVLYHQVKQAEDCVE